MKKLILITLISILYLSVKGQRHIAKSQVLSKQQQAEALVNSYLITNLNDPHSYDNVGFTKLDSVFNDIDVNGRLSYAKNRLYRLTAFEIPGYYRVIDYLKNASDKEGIEKYTDSIKKAMADTALFSNEIKFFYEHYKKEQIGWRMLHQYRARNAYNALMLVTDTVNINLYLNQIQSMNRVVEKN